MNPQAVDDLRKALGVKVGVIVTCLYTTFDILFLSVPLSPYVFLHVCLLGYLSVSFRTLYQTLAAKCIFGVCMCACVCVSVSLKHHFVFLNVFIIAMCASCCCHRKVNFESPVCVSSCPPICLCVLVCQSVCQSLTQRETMAKHLCVCLSPPHTTLCHVTASEQDILTLDICGGVLIFFEMVVMSGSFPPTLCVCVCLPVCVSVCLSVCVPSSLSPGLWCLSVQACVELWPFPL